MFLPTSEDIRRLRLKAGLTQKELAKRAGVSQSLIARIERGDINPRLSTLRKIVEVLYEVLEEGLTAEAIMHKPVISVHEDDSVEKVVKIMEKYGISQVPVLDSNNRVVGTIMESTILKQLVNKKVENIFKKKAKEIMEPPLPVIPPSTKNSTILSLLSEYPAVLVSSQGKIIGIISKIDFIKSRLKG